MKRLLSTIVAVLLISTPVLADAFDDAMSVYEKGDYATALRLLQKLAEQGNADAQNRVGYIYSEGKGAPKDYALAITWYRKAAEQGHVIGMSNLALMYAEGRGVPQNYATAAVWNRKAAERGNESSQARLGLMYADGQGVPQDYMLAHMWLNLAAAQGAISAAKDRDAVATKMTAAQIAKAQKMASEWKPTP